MSLDGAQLRRSIKSFRKLLDRQPNHIGHLEVLVRLSVQAGRPRDAARYLIRRAELLAEQGELGAAVADATSAQGMVPGSRVARRLLTELEARLPQQVPVLLTQIKQRAAPASLKPMALAPEASIAAEDLLPVMELEAFDGQALPDSLPPPAGAPERAIIGASVLDTPTIPARPQAPVEAIVEVDVEVDEFLRAATTDRFKAIGPAMMARSAPHTIDLDFELDGALIEIEMAPDGVELAQAASMLAQSALFADLTDEERGLLAAQCTLIMLEPGEALFEVGERPGLLYVVMSGALWVSVGARRRLTLGAGEVAGVVCALEDTAAQARAVAGPIIGAQVLAIPGERVDAMLRREVVRRPFEVEAERRRTLYSV